MLTKQQLAKRQYLFTRYGGYYYATFVTKTWNYWRIASDCITEEETVRIANEDFVARRLTGQI